MKIKRILITALVMILAGGASGCMGERKQNSNEAALAYMEQKYGEPFEYAGSWGNSLSGTHELLVRCDSLQDAVLVEIENYRSDDPVFRDNYLAVKYEGETRAFLEQCALSVFGEAAVYYSAIRTGLSEDLAADASFEEYLADTRAPLSILVEVPAGSFSSDDQARALGEAVAAAGCHFRLTLMVVEEGVYGTLDREALSEKIGLRDFVHCAEVRSLGSGLTVNWLGRE